MIKAAVSKGNYDYYHLLSGEDLPIKTQDYIHSFFEKNAGKEFIRFEDEDFKYSDRIKYWYPIQEYVGRPYQHRFAGKISKCLLLLQKAAKVNRNKDIEFQKGTNWFSITDQLARYVISQEKWIRNTFKHSLCCDEVFLHTIVNGSEFKERLYRHEFDNNLDAIKRLIDWERGDPYIFTYSDRVELAQSDMIFARKFDCEVDSQIIDYVVSELAAAREGTRQ